MDPYTLLNLNEEISKMDYQVFTLKSRPDLSENLQALNKKSWPNFIIYGDSYSWDQFYTELSDFLILLTERKDILIGAGFTVPVFWNGKLDDLPNSIQRIIEAGLNNKDSSVNTLIPVAALVDNRFRGENISTRNFKTNEILSPSMWIFKPDSPGTANMETSLPSAKYRKLCNIPLCQCK